MDRILAHFWFTVLVLMRIHLKAGNLGILIHHSIDAPVGWMTTAAHSGLIK